MLGGRVDILVNNAGRTRPALTTDLADADLDAMLAVNIRAPYVLVAALHPAMADRGSGLIVNIGSWMAQVGTPFGGDVHRDQGRRRAADPSRAPSSAPAASGSTPSPRRNPHPRQRGPEAVLDDVTGTPPARLFGPTTSPRAVAFLASDDATMIHGITLYVDGGISTTRLS